MQAPARPPGGRVRRVGGQKTLKVNVRVVVSTNRDLAQEVADGRFREDLYYRLHVLLLHIAPLNERAEDIMLFAERFAQVYAKQNGLPTPTSPQTPPSSSAWGWPGNVRELENVIYALSSWERPSKAPRASPPRTSSSDRPAPPRRRARWSSTSSTAFQEAIANKSMADVERVAILSTRADRR